MNYAPRSSFSYSYVIFVGLLLYLCSYSIALAQSVTPSPTNPLDDTHYDDTYVAHIPYAAVTNTSWRTIIIPDDASIPSFIGLGAYVSGTTTCPFSWGTGISGGNAGFVNGACSASGENGDIENNWGDGSFASIVGSFHILIYHFATTTANTSAGDCIDNGYTQCLVDNGAPAVDQIYTFAAASPPPTTDDSLMDWLNTATTTFEQTSGFSIVGVTNWMADNLLKLWAGMGLSVLYTLRYWIVALIIIASILFFAAKAWRFFRH